MNIMPYQKYFNRFELKYQISLKERDRIINYARPFMKLDTHVQNGRDYEVRSLYFDSLFGNSFRDKQNGVAIRKKLRIRFYPGFKRESGIELAFIEIKKKTNENVSKSRIIVPLEDTLSILDHHSPTAKNFYEKASLQDKNTLNEIWFISKKYHIKPVCMVSYKRQPYHSKFGRGFRLTFDTDVAVRNYNFNFHFGGGSKMIIPKGMCVMEIKFNNFIPNWAIKIIQKNDCIQYKISKFAEGLEKTKTRNFAVI